MGISCSTVSEVSCCTTFRNEAHEFVVEKVDDFHSEADTEAGNVMSAEPSSSIAWCPSTKSDPYDVALQAFSKITPSLENVPEEQLLLLYGLSDYIEKGDAKQSERPGMFSRREKKERWHAHNLHNGKNLEAAKMEFVEEWAKLSFHLECMDLD